MRLIIQPDSNGVSEWAAAYIVKRIRERKACCNRPFVLGLPTGSTPLGTYKALISYCQEGAESFLVNAVHPVSPPSPPWYPLPPPVSIDQR